MSYNMPGDVNWMGWMSTDMNPAFPFRDKRVLIVVVA